MRGGLGEGDVEFGDVGGGVGAGFWAAEVAFPDVGAGLAAEGFGFAVELGPRGEEAVVGALVDGADDFGFGDGGLEDATGGGELAVDGEADFEVEGC